MPTEPDNNIEGQLKSWAAKRRDEAGSAFELHPVTRRLLQDEVARNFPQAPQTLEVKAGWLALLRPRLAFALSVVAVMAIVGVAVLPSLSRAKSKSKAMIVATEKRDTIVDQAEQLRSVSADQAKQSVEAMRRDEKNAAQRQPAPALAVNAPKSSSESTPALARSDRYGEVAKSSDARDKSAPPASGLAQRQPDRESITLASGGKAKESRPAKDENDLAKRTGTTGNEVKQEFAVGKSGLKTANAEDLSRVEAQIGARTRATPVETPAGAPAATLALNYQKAQAGGTAQTPDATGKSEQVPLANASGFLDQVAGNATQRFSQATRYRRNFNSPPTPNILNSFQLEQTGRQLRIVDADGSVYEGAFSPPEQVAEEVTAKIGADDAELKKNVALSSLSNQERVLQADGTTTIDQASAFRVVGTNRSLNQMIVFTGNFLVATNTMSTGIAGRYQQNGAQLLRQTVESSQAASNASPQMVPRVQGQVIVGGGDRIEINATPAEP